MIKLDNIEYPSMAAAAEAFATATRVWLDGVLQCNSTKE